jgi:hypothetical protein
LILIRYIIDIFMFSFVFARFIADTPHCHIDAFIELRYFIDLLPPYAIIAYARDISQLMIALRRHYRWCRIDADIDIFAIIITPWFAITLSAFDIDTPHIDCW